MEIKEFASKTAEEMQKRLGMDAEAREVLKNNGVVWHALVMGDRKGSRNPSGLP